MSLQSERARYHPGFVERSRVEPARNGRFALIVTRELRQSPSRVWNLLTDPEELREWAPFDAIFDLGVPGTTILSSAGGSHPVAQPSHVRRAEAPRRLEYTWGRDVLGWELAAAGAGTLLTLRHTMVDRKQLSRAAAGWQICLDVAERYLEGRPIGRIVADEAKRFGWDRLNAEYASRIGLRGPPAMPAPAGGAPQARWEAR